MQTTLCDFEVKIMLSALELFHRQICENVDPERYTQALNHAAGMVMASVEELRDKLISQAQAAQPRNAFRD